MNSDYRSDDTERMMPPARKKQRIVDLSYVPMSQGVVFLAPDSDSRRNPMARRENMLVEPSMALSNPSLECSVENRAYHSSCEEYSIILPASNFSEGRGGPGGSLQMSLVNRTDSIDDSSSTRTETNALTEFKRVDTRFSDIIGHGDVKIRIDELLLPLALPSSLVHSILKGVRALPASILLYGPPGCGKTQLARAIAGESQAAFLSIGPSDILSKFVGESEASLRVLFASATETARRTESRCAVLFFDEIDALGYSRGDESGKSIDGDGSRRILAELLIQLSNLSTLQQPQRGHKLEKPEKRREDDESESHDECVRVMVIAATNRLADCDPALIRRFAIQVHVGLPSVRDRRKIFQKFLRDFEHCLTKADLGELAIATEGWSGSDLESLAREAAMTPIRECLQLAAQIKRKARRMEQQGGVASAQDTSKAQDAFQVAKNVLMEEFQSLRSVTAIDFQAAMAFLLGSTTSADGCTIGGAYDSSSDSDDQAD
jgi:SpoVK/Ycf46/Vps4 family AAA+-type ATPase